LYEAYLCALPVRPIASRGLQEWYQCDPADDRPHLMFFAGLNYKHSDDEKKPVDALLRLYSGAIRLDRDDIDKIMDMLAYPVGRPLFYAGIVGQFDYTCNARVRRVEVEVVQTCCGIHVYLGDMKYTLY